MPERTWTPEDVEALLDFTVQLYETAVVEHAIKVESWTGPFHGLMCKFGRKECDRASLGAVDGGELELRGALEQIAAEESQAYPNLPRIYEIAREALSGSAATKEKP